MRDLYSMAAEEVTGGASPLATEGGSDPEAEGGPLASGSLAKKVTSGG